jgi:hypothetical protein
MIAPDPQMPLGDPYLTNSALIEGDIHGQLKKKHRSDTSAHKNHRTILPYLKELKHLMYTESRYKEFKQEDNPTSQNIHTRR